MSNDKKSNTPHAEVFRLRADPTTVPKFGLVQRRGCPVARCNDFLHHPEPTHHARVEGYPPQDLEWIHMK